MVQHKVANHRVRDFLRIGNRDLSLPGSESLHFDNVAMLILQLTGQLIECVLGGLAQRSLARTETNFCLRRGLGIGQYC